MFAVSFFNLYSNPVVSRHCPHFTEEETEAERVNDLLQFTSHGLLEPELLAPGPVLFLPLGSRVQAEAAETPVFPLHPGMCGGEVWGAARARLPSCWAGAPVSTSCLCGVHLLIHPTYPRTALCRVSHCAASGHYG